MSQGNTKWAKCDRCGSESPGAYDGMVHWRRATDADEIDDIYWSFARCGIFHTESTAKICSCRHRYTLDQWKQLPFVGRQEELELRNCPHCKTTLALTVA